MASTPKAFNLYYGPALPPTTHDARAILKSILRNAPAFTGWGKPTSWDWPTLRATYPQTALTMKALRIYIAKAEGRA